MSPAAATPTFQPMNVNFGLFPPPGDAQQGRKLRPPKGRDRRRNDRARRHRFRRLARRTRHARQLRAQIAHGSNVVHGPKDAGTRRRLIWAANTANRPTGRPAGHSPRRRCSASAASSNARPTADRPAPAAVGHSRPRRQQIAGKMFFAARRVMGESAKPANHAKRRRRPARRRAPPGRSPANGRASPPPGFRRAATPVR